MTTIPRPIALILMLLVVTVAAPAAEGPDAADRLHDDYERLLQKYVLGYAVDYHAWSTSDPDLRALTAYVDALAALDPAGWPRDHALAYWINLYNAVTLELILDNYPLESIKDLGGFLKKGPWSRELVTVAGRELTLDEIEHEIIRPDFGDPRIHFAVNCASVGCPPLQPTAYRGEDLDAQLDHACREALNDERWLRVEDGTIRVTRVFDWFGEDFDSVRGFIERYHDEPLPDGKIEYLDWDWSLNAAR